jgi:acyl-CoA thioesterase II
MHDGYADDNEDPWSSSRSAVERSEPIAHATGNLELDTRVYGESGSYKAFVSPAWEIWGPNGGYMASIALRAAAAESHLKQPVSIYCQFLRPARFDWLDAQVSVVQRGRRSESIRVSLAQAGKPVLEALVRTALPGEGLEHESGGPLLAAPETLPRADDLRRADAPSFPFWKNIEARVLQPERFAQTPAPQPPHWLEWYRFRPNAIYDDPVVDAARALVLIDTLGWPAAWLQHPDTTLRGPNLDVAAFFHAPTQDSAWLLCEQHSPVAARGMIGTSARIYGRDGRLLASGGAQLMCVDPS